MVNLRRIKQPLLELHCQENEQENEKDEKKKDEHRDEESLNVGHKVREKEAQIRYTPRGR